MYNKDLRSSDCSFSQSKTTDQFLSGKWSLVSFRILESSYSNGHLFGKTALLFFFYVVKVDGAELYLESSLILRAFSTQLNKYLLAIDYEGDTVINKGRYKGPKTSEPSV